MLWDRYLREVWEQQHRYATWSPDAPLDVGWYGTIVQGVFEKVGDLDSLGIKFTLDQRPGAAEGSFTSRTGVGVDFKGAGSLDRSVFPQIKKADVGFGVTFSSGGSAVVRTVDSQYSWIRDPISVRHAILALAQARKWNDDWWVVEQTTSAESGFVAIGEDVGAKATIRGSADVKVAKGNFAFSVAAQSGRARIDTLRKFTPFYVPFRLRRSWWQKISALVFPTELPPGQFGSLSPVQTLDFSPGSLGIRLAETDAADVDDGTLLSLFTEEPLTSMEELGLAEPLSPSVSALMDADLHNTGEHA